LLLAFFQLIGVVGWIKAPRAIGLEVDASRRGSDGTWPIDDVNVALGNRHELADIADKEPLVGNIDVCDRQRVAIDIRDTSEELIG